MSTAFSKFFVDMEFLSFVRVRPAELQWRSGDAEAAGIAKMLLAVLESKGNLFKFNFQNSKGSSPKFLMTCNSMYSLFSMSID